MSRMLVHLSNDQICLVFAQIHKTWHVNFSVLVVLSIIRYGTLINTIFTRFPKNINHTMGDSIISATSSSYIPTVLQKPTFVMFYSPQCEESRKLDLLFRDLSLSFEHAHDKVQFIQMNGTEGNIPPEAGLTIDSLPSLKFYDGKSLHSVVDYFGELDLGDLRSFIIWKVGVRPKMDEAETNTVVDVAEARESTE